MRASQEGKFLTSSKREPAFISKGFMYWKEATSAFKKHQVSECHREANEAVISLPKQILGHVGELSSEENKEEKAMSRKIFMIILGQRVFFKQVCSIACLILVMPATNASSERSFSTMKSYLRSTMGQARLNHLMTLHVYWMN